MPSSHDRARGAHDRERAALAREVVDEVKRRQLSTLLESSPDATVILDAEGRISEWNPAAEVLLGRPRSEAVGVHGRSLLAPEDRARFDTGWARLVAGSAGPRAEALRVRGGVGWLPISAHVAPIRASHDFGGVVVILRVDHARSERAPGVTRSTDRAVDPDPAVGAAQRLGVLERDELTGLPGRRRLQQRLAEVPAAGLARGVAVMDVDAFALVNEAYGPDIGDLILRELADRLVSVAGIADLGRWQADSFVWVVDAPDPAEELEALVERVVLALDEPFEVGVDNLRLTVSTGMVTGGLAPTADLFAAARDALRAAKDAGRDRATWYSEALRTSSTSAFRLANDLYRGIQQGELRLHFQPIMALATNDVVGVEALVRWERLGVGLLSPASFLDVAERTGQIVLLGAWVAREACLAAAGLVRLGTRPRSVSINVSARQLSDPGLVEMLREAIRESGCAPSTIIIEVTETALMYDLGAATATLEAIKALGVGLDLDDFGTGYSSLLYLKHFPVDRIKIDRSFVEGLGTNPADTAIVASTIALAHSIGIRAVAEGVETDEQLAILRQMGCDFAQGFLLSRPLALGAINEWLAEHVPADYDPAGEGGAEGDPGAAARRDGGETGARAAQADVRDAKADARDAVADVRDRSSDEREGLADVREGIADVRDEVADVRDEIADVRDEVATERDHRADGEERSTLERWDAEFGRSRASEDRVTGNGDRLEAERRRDAAQADRESTADGRAQAGHDRDDADADRGPQEREKK